MDRFVLTAFQRFQKDAIWRQMQEYKREKSSLETRLKETSKATTYHDDHLRIIDAWYSQVCISSLIGYSVMSNC